MFERTDHDAAPWHVIPADSKKYTRVAVIEQTIAAVEAAMRDHGLEPLDPDELGV
jgi:polyphosphate kinase 2 (PPK2 family)